MARRRDRGSPSLQVSGPLSSAPGCSSQWEAEDLGPPGGPTSVWASRRPGSMLLAALRRAQSGIPGPAATVTRPVGAGQAPGAPRAGVCLPRAAFLCGPHVSGQRFVGNSTCVCLGVAGPVFALGHSGVCRRGALLPSRRACMPATGSTAVLVHSLVTALNKAAGGCSGPGAPLDSGAREHPAMTQRRGQAS